MTLTGPAYQFLPCKSIRVRVFLFAFLGQPHCGSSDLEKSFHRFILLQLT